MPDVLVIGAGLGGLECGHILARNGFRVTVLERQARPGGALQGFRRGRYSFDTGLHYVGGLGPGESLEWLMRYHGLLDLPWRRLDCSEEVIVDGRSWTVPSGYGNFVPGMARQFPGQEKALSAYLAALQEVASGIRDLRADHGPLLRRSAAAFLEETIPDPLLRKVLGGRTLRMDMDLETLPFYVYAQISASFLQSAWRLEGESMQIPERLCERIQALGGRILTGKEAVRIDSGRVTTQDGEIFEADHIISDLPASVTAALVPAIRPVYARRLARLPETYGVFSVHIALKPGMLPYVGHSISFEDGMLLHMRVPSDGWAETVELLLPVRQWPSRRGAEYTAWKKTLADRCILRAAQRLPALPDAIEAVYTSSPLTWQSYTGSASAFGIRKDFRCPEQTFLSPRTPVPGLYLTGQNLNLHGVLGVSMTALHTCAQILGFDKIEEEFGL